MLQNIEDQSDRRCLATPRKVLHSSVKPIRTPTMEVKVLTHKRRLTSLITVLMMLFGVSSALATNSYGSPSETLKPTKPVCANGNCQFTPSVPTVTVVTPEQTVTTYTYTEARELITKYESRTNTIIAVNMVPRGVKSAKGCVDPIRKGWIKTGQAFRNARLNGSPFWDRWEKGDKICGAKRVKIGKFFYMKGTKMDCGNKGILIPLGPAKKVKRVTKTVIQVSTIVEAVDVSITSTTTTIPAVTSLSYSCPNGGELVKRDNGVPMCKICPKQPVCACADDDHEAYAGDESDDCEPTKPPVTDCPSGNHDGMYNGYKSSSTDDSHNTCKLDDKPAKKCHKGEKYAKSGQHNTCKPPSHKDDHNFGYRKG